MEMVFLDWARSHPAKLGGDAAILVEAAFVEAWPCPKAPPPKVSRIPPYAAPDQLLPSR
jgi:hypothetical protein